VCAKKYATPDQLQKLTENGKKNKIKKIMYKEEYFCNNIKPLIELGWSVTKIFKHLKINEGTVRRCTKRYGGKTYVQKLINNGKEAQQTIQNNAYDVMNSGRIKFIKEQDEKRLPKILELVEKGYDKYQIGKQTGLWYKTVIRIVQRNCNKSVLGILRQNLQNNKIPNNELRKERISKTHRAKYDTIFEQVIPLIEQGQTSKQIGDLLNRHHQAIRNLVKRCGSDALFLKLLNNNAQRRRDIAYNNFVNFGKTKTSKCEKMLYQIVLKHYPNSISSLPIKREDGHFWIIDVAIPEHKLAVEFDGSYWHNIEKDKIRDKALLKLGWKTLRLRYDYTPTSEELEQHFLTELKDYIK
jgi:very-short-patch-repair endonuclease/DNA-binding NarL/FixJ family response regulator